MNYKVNGVSYSEKEYNRLFGKKEKIKKPKKSFAERTEDKLEKK